LFAIPLFVTQVQVGTYSTAGLALTPAAVLGAVAALAAGRLANRSGYTLPSGLGLLIAVLGPLAMAWLDPGSSVLDVLLASGLIGVAVGMGTPAMAGASLAAARDADAGAGSGWYHSIRVLGVALGVVVFASVSSSQGDIETSLERAIARMGPELQARAALDSTRSTLQTVADCDSMECVDTRLRGASGTNEDRQVIHAAMRERIALSYRKAFLCCSVLALASFLGWLALGRAGPTGPLRAQCPPG
jgi:hypothetical protein